MKSFIISIALTVIISAFTAYADDPILNFSTDPTSVPYIESAEEVPVRIYDSIPNYIYETVEEIGQEPVFPGGKGALMKYVADHLRYPSTAQIRGIQGIVTVQFVVTNTGAVGQVKVVRGLDPDLDKEAVRIAKSLPKFIPAKVDGMPVNCWYTLPVTFKLQGV